MITDNNSFTNTYLLTTRFNHKTLKENRDYLSTYKKNKENNFRGCFYGSPKHFPNNIPLKANILLFEMNNSNNKIEGVSYLYNRPYTKKRLKIYKEDFYNRITYISYLHIERNVMSKDQLDILEKIENILFYGKGHLKRGYGFTSIPEKHLNKKLKEDIYNVFISK